MSKLEFLEKQQKLESIKLQLKSFLFGLNPIIDQVVDSIASWYFFPEHQTRPLVINLWGMTGMGKTELVRLLVELLDFTNNFYQFDIGELGHGPTGNIRGILSESYQLKGPEPSIILLDEFQLGRTVNESRHEINHKELRIIWQLLDNGKVNYLEMMMMMGRRNVNSILSQFDYWVKQGMTIKSGMISSEYFGYFDEDDEESEESENQKVEFRFVFSKRRVKSIFEVNRHNFKNTHELRNYIKQLDTQGVRKLLLDSLALTVKPSELDFRQSLIFVVGNLDEAYLFAKNQSPDISPNVFHLLTSDIKLPDIKQALLKRFRSEQIGRLGNNHVIYPSLNEQAFYSIIDSELQAISRNFLSVTKRPLVFHYSIREWIFQEGVTSTQGVRPLKSSIKYGIEDLIPKIMVEESKMKVPAERFELKFENKIVAQFFNENDHVHEIHYPVIEKIRQLKISRKDDLQAVVGVHESGHAIVHLAICGEIPQKISSVAAASGSEGFVTTGSKKIQNLKNLKETVAVLVAGFLAEQEIFGTDLVTGGSEADLEKATEMTVTYFKECGFGGTLMRIALTDDYYDHAYHNVNPIEEHALNFIK